MELCFAFCVGNADVRSGKITRPRIVLLSCFKSVLHAFPLRLEDLISFCSLYLFECFLGYRC